MMDRKNVKGKDGGFAHLLPAVLRSDSWDGASRSRVSDSFMSRFMAVFEDVWTTREKTGGLSLSELMDTLPEFFHPGLSFLFDADKADGKLDQARGEVFARFVRAAPHDADSPQNAMRLWLDWLAGWFDLTPMENWSLDKRRHVLTRLLPLYRKRGTREGLQGLLRLFTDRPFHVIDDVRVPAFRVGKNSRPGGRAAVGGFPADYFIVVLRIPAAEKHRVAELSRRVRRIVDEEKPVQTKYSLVFQVHERARGFRIAVSRLGVDTVIARQGGEYAGRK